jgi:hypothetical protein
LESERNLNFSGGKAVVELGWTIAFWAVGDVLLFEFFLERCDEKAAQGDETPCENSLCRDGIS